jgi:hypothetical protein
VIEGVVGEVVIDEFLKGAPIQMNADPIGDFRGLRIFYAPDGDCVAFIGRIMFGPRVLERDFIELWRDQVRASGFVNSKVVLGKGVLQRYGANRLLNLVAMADSG